jgi:hypothetical protein
MQSITRRDDIYQTRIIFAVFLWYNLRDWYFQNILCPAGLELGDKFVDHILLYNRLDTIVVNTVKLAHGRLFHRWQSGYDPLHGCRGYIHR